MAPAYKITYFNGRGLAETWRFLLKYGGIEFEDVRFEEKDWPQVKNKTPFGQVPLLEHNGKVIGQSVAVARYLAKLVKLTGSTDWEDLEIDSVVDTVNDLKSKILPVFMEQDESKKQELTDEFLNVNLPYTFSRLEVIAQKNKGHLAIGRLTWADFYLATVSLLFDVVAKKDTLEIYPTLKAIRETVNALPAIKKWIEIRPETDF